MSLQIPSKVETTRELAFLKGDFSLNDFSIPYFSTVVDWDFARKEFSLIEDVAEFYVNDQPIDALFQRDIDWDRVRNDLVKYYLNVAQPHFFNSLTIALLPKRGDAFGAHFAEVDDLPDTFQTSGVTDQVTVGGAQVAYYEGTGKEIGVIRWDRRHVLAVAVDGQHRLAAIKEAGTRLHSKKRESTRIPVIFILPDSSVGLQYPGQPVEDSVSNVLRQVFIDINKNTRPISTTRLVLLDDGDLYRVCTRACIGRKLTSEPSPDRIPLSQVDWISEDTNKIDVGPFLTTVLLLEEFARLILDRPNLKPEVDDYETNLSKWRNWIEDTFSPEPAELEDLSSTVVRCYERQTEVSWMPEQMEIFARNFSADYRPLVCKVLAEISDYSRLRGYLQANGLQAPWFVNLYSALKIEGGDSGEKKSTRIRAIITEENPDWSIDADFFAHLKHIDETIKEGRWAFKVVFQRAIFTAVAYLLKNQLWLGSGADCPSVFADKVIPALNSLLDSRLGFEEATLDPSGKGPKFWRGIGLRVDDSIDFTKGGAKRISLVLCAWVFMMLDEDDPLEYQEACDSKPAYLKCLAQGPMNTAFKKAAIAQGLEEQDEIEQFIESQREQVYTALRDIALLERAK